jgi:hypothetical protein
MKASSYAVKKYTLNNMELKTEDEWQSGEASGDRRLHTGEQNFEKKY